MAQADSTEPACRVFAKNWAASMPDAIVADKLTDDDGFLDPDCIDDSRLDNMAANGLIPDEMSRNERGDGESEEKVNGGAPP